MELNFQKIVLIVSAVFLVIMLIVIGVLLYKNKFTEVFPPIISNCPDYWEDKSNGNSSNCVNIKGLGTCGVKSKDFSGPDWTSNAGLCNKARWARNCNLTWDGITNNPSCLS
jgi:hypothetical protein